MSQLHLHAQSGDVAPYVLLPGDPGRASFIAKTYLEGATLYNENRGLLGYSGSYQGVPVSVQTTGMGCPSLSIVVEELIRLGARTLIRVGTAGIISPTVRPGDHVVVTAAEPGDGTTAQYLRGDTSSLAPDFEVVRALVDSPGQEEFPLHVGPVRTEDAFYATSRDDVAVLAGRGVLAVEMESSALFLLGRLRGTATGCVLCASNAVGDSSFADPEIMRRSVAAMVSRALGACVQLAKHDWRNG